MGLRLKIAPIVTYTTVDGVATWDLNRVTMINTVDAGHDDVVFGNIYKMKLQLNRTTGWDSGLFVFCASSHIGDPSARLCKGFLLDSSLVITENSSSHGMAYSLDGLSDQFLNLEITTSIPPPVWSSWDPYYYIDELKINGQVQAGVQFDALSTAGGWSGWGLGQGINLWDASTLTNFKDGNIWDVQMETSMGILLHDWKGYPDGDTLPAWADTVGDVDAITVTVSSTESIIGVNYTGAAGSKLSISQLSTVMDWAGVDEYVSYSPTGSIDCCTNRKMTFQMILDATSGFNNNGMWNFRNPTGDLTHPYQDSWEALLDGSMIHVDFGGTGVGTHKYALEDFPIGTPFTIETTKSFHSIDSFKINGVELQSHGTADSTSSSNNSALGRVGSADFFLKDGAIWDFKIWDTDTDTLLHAFKGYGPNANQSSAWVDDVSNAIPVMHGADIGLRPVSGGAISTLLSNKLKITGGQISVTGLLDWGGQNSDDGVMLSSVPTQEGERKYDFKIYLDQVAWQNPNWGTIFQSTASYNSKFAVYFHADNNFIQVHAAYGSSGPSAKTVEYTYSFNDCPVDSSDNIMNFVIDVSDYIVNSVTVNGADWPIDSSENGSNWIYSGANIGCTARSDGAFLSNEFPGFIWDVKLYVDDALTNYWLGRPAGNTNVAWEDQVGAIDGSVIGLPGIGNI
jgi:hypothetical protein